METLDWNAVSSELTELLRLNSPPLAISFTDELPRGVEPFDGSYPSPGSDGRTGAVPAGCVFWMLAEARTFGTVAADHANCSVGSMTHGFVSLSDVAENEDVDKLLESGWVTEEVIPSIPVVREKKTHVVYGPLAETPVDPDVVFLRINAKQLMVLFDSIARLRIEGKPQCHIIPIAKEEGDVAVSVGCMLSRVRTGMPPSEMTCAIPGSKIGEFVECVSSTSRTDAEVARYAAEDAKRFDKGSVG